MSMRNARAFKTNLQYRLILTQRFKQIAARALSKSGFGQRYLPYQTSPKSDESNQTSSLRWNSQLLSEDVYRERIRNKKNAYILITHVKFIFL